MPFDYPGLYAMRFDGVDEARPSAFFKRLSGPAAGFVLRPARSGILKIEGLQSATVRGGMLLTEWYKASSPGGGPPRDLLIDVLNQARVATARWRIRSARPVKWVMASEPASPTAAPAVETLEIAHMGFLADRGL